MKTKLMAIGLFLLLSIGASAAETNEINPNVRAVQLLERVQEIRTMDFKEMDDVERMALKEEAREIRDELRVLKSAEGLDDKVSISIGLIIIILLILIII